jgi:pimeloyl-ACP methyl ester carboxylesterase
MALVAARKKWNEQIRQFITQFNTPGGNYDDMNLTAQSLSNITARTLVVHGDHDKFFEIPVNMHSAIPNAALWIIPGGDHVPIYDATIPFTSTALQFLDGSGSK